MADYVPAALRETVVERAGGRCEYCLHPQAVSFLTFEVEHIIARKHGGLTTESNLALACPYCNKAKGTDIASLDPDSGELAPLYNPRTQQWETHFQLNGSQIAALTAIGRVTINILRLNHPDRVSEREALIAAGMYP